MMSFRSRSSPDLCQFSSRDSISNRWLRQARKNGFDKSIQKSVERLLAPDNADIVTGHAFRASGNQGFGFGQLGSTV